MRTVSPVSGSARGGPRRPVRISLPSAERLTANEPLARESVTIAILARAGR